VGVGVWACNYMYTHARTHTHTHTHTHKVCVCVCVCVNMCVCADLWRHTHTYTYTYRPLSRRLPAQNTGQRLHDHVHVTQRHQQQGVGSVFGEAFRPMSPVSFAFDWVSVASTLGLFCLYIRPLLTLTHTSCQCQVGLFCS
jgi:hypothetical protein